jgi:hypothetical protein
MNIFDRTQPRIGPLEHRSGDHHRPDRTGLGTDRQDQVLRPEG